jgi:hypothetical protein
MMMVLLALLLAALGCVETPHGAAPGSSRVDAPVAGQRADSAPRTDSATVLVQGPTLVAFYPQVTQAQVDSSEELATVFDDFSYHLSTATDGLRALGIAATERPVGQIQLREAGRWRAFIPAKDSAAVGYLFVSPGRADRVYYGVMSHSDLIELAHEYLESSP